MTLQQLSNGWNDLRTAALGRSGAGAVPKALAQRVAVEWERFRQWYEDIGPLGADRDETGEWTELYNQLRAQVSAAGRAVPRELQPPENWTTTVARGAGEAAQLARTTLFFVALGAGAVVVMSLRGRR